MIDLRVDKHVWLHVFTVHYIITKYIFRTYASAMLYFVESSD